METETGNHVFVCGNGGNGQKRWNPLHCLSSKSKEPSVHVLHQSKNILWMKMPFGIIIFCCTKAKPTRCSREGRATFNNIWYDIRTSCKCRISLACGTQENFNISMFLPRWPLHDYERFERVVNWSSGLWRSLWKWAYEAHFRPSPRLHGFSWGTSWMGKKLFEFQACPCLQLILCYMKRKLTGRAQPLHPFHGPLTNPLMCSCAPCPWQMHSEFLLLLSHLRSLSCELLHISHLKFKYCLKLRDWLPINLSQ